MNHLKKFVLIKDTESKMYLSIVGWSEDKSCATLFELDDAKNLVLNNCVEFERVESEL